MLTDASDSGGFRVDAFGRHDGGCLCRFQSIGCAMQSFIKVITNTGRAVYLCVTR